MLRIDGVTLNTGMLYQKVRFFLDNEHPSYWVEGATNTGWPVTLLPSDLVNPVVQNDDPTVYSLSSTMSDEAYEALINTGIDKGELTERGPVYLPESDKRLTGTIYYRLGDDMTKKSASFSMVNDDFRRNQTWSVYAYYTGSSELQVSTVKVTDWSMGQEWERIIHNW